MPISPAGTTNLAALNVPNLYVQIVPPSSLLNGVPTDIIGIVGTASWGQKNSPVVVGSIQQYVSNFGIPKPIIHDLGTSVYNASLEGASNFRCVRVSDGTDTEAAGSLIDDLLTPRIGANLTAIYTGSTGNTLKASIQKGSALNSYKLSVYMDGGIPEVFDNITGTGSVFWENVVDAINNGQSIQRGSSQLVVASLPTSIGDVTVTTEGSYSAIPVVTIADGVGATFSVVMKAISAAVNVAGTGYAIGDTITLAGGTSTVATVVTVDTVDGFGAILTSHISTDGLYTVLPANPALQDTTSGVGVNASFDLTWGLAEINVSTVGSGYSETSILTISLAGGGDATFILGSVDAPKLATSSLSGGTDGSNVTAAQLVGSDISFPRTGMYALRNNIAGGVFFLADQSDPTYWSAENLFAQQEGAYVMSTIAPGYQDNIAGAVNLLGAAAIDSMSISVCTGDWIQFNDPFNGVQRFISPQSKKAGILASTLPSASSLNKQMNGILGTQKTLESRTYTTADLSQLRTGRLELITNPIPSGNLFGCRFGINTSSNPLTQTDNYTRMVNFIGQTILSGMGIFVGKAQTETVREQAKAMLYSFLHNLFQLGMIGDVNSPGDFSKAVSIVLDASNNPPDRVALGYMQADVGVVLFSIVQYFVVNLNAEQGSFSVSPASNGGL